MYRWLIVLSGVALLFLPACQRQEAGCPAETGTPQYITTPPQLLPTPAPVASSSPIPFELGGQTVLVDKVVEGPLCNDSWSGTIYVACNVQVYQWEEQPTFLKNCNLSIAPGTVVYVGHHQDTAYYNGCSCHTGEIAEP